MKQITKESILSVLEQNKEGLTTTELSKKIGLSRSVTSLYLNELFQSGDVDKKASRPVLWVSINERESQMNVFERYIGYNGSVHDTIEKIMDAILYPPLGLPVLFHGASGVGKSYLAQLVYQYLLEHKKLQRNVFSVLNCADYASNPELLSSQLFGHVKGAFTGADSAKRGLLTQTDGGVLFLDEVHRLSHENQEKLFQFMDTRAFRPLGEEKEVVHSNVRLLFATTEDPKIVLLPTFYRRISLIVDLPNFHDRPLDERMALIEELFRKEKKQMNCELAVSPSLFNRLAEGKYEGNVGTLLNQIKLLCAQALRLHHSGNSHILYVNDCSSLPNDYQKQTWINITDQAIFEKGTHIDPEMFQLSKDLQKTQEFVDFRHRFLHSAVWEQVKLENNQDPFLLDFIKKITDQNKKLINHPELTQQIVYQIAYFVKENHSFFERKLILTQLKKIKKQFTRTFLFADKLTMPLDETFRPISLLLFTITLIGKISEEIYYQGLLVAHGDSTASSIQNVVNQLCSDYIFDAINMPLDSSVEDVINAVSKWLQERDTSHGVIMLVDMGSLTHIYQELKPQIKGDLLLINNLTTAYALELGQMLLAKDSFHTITKTAEQNFHTKIQYFSGFAREQNLIISSTLGTKATKKLKEIFIKYVREDYQVIDLNFNELKEVLKRGVNDESYLRETRLIIHTAMIEEPISIPTFNLLDILDESGIEYFQSTLSEIVSPQNIESLTAEIVHFFSKEGLVEKLTFLNPDVIVKQIEDVTDSIEHRFHFYMSPKKKFNITLHFALMIERTILGEKPYPVPDQLYDSSLFGKPFYPNIKSILYSLEQFYRIDISDWEIYVLFEILSN